MTGEGSDQDVVLGRTLAETERLNSPAANAGHAARDAVLRSGPAPIDAAARLWLFRLGMVLLAVAIRLIAAAAVLLRPMLAP